MKVLNIGPSLNKSRGGMATVIKGIHDSEVLNESYDIDFFTSFIDGVKIWRVIYSIFAIIHFRFIYKKYNLFHIHVASYTSTVRKLMYADFLKKHKKKVIIHIHGGSYIKFYNGLTKEKQEKLTSKLNNVDMVIALSEEWKMRLEDCIGIKNCVVLKNGIDISKFSDAVTSVADNQKSFLMLGRLCKNKGVYDLIEAVEMIKREEPEIQIFLAGDGEVEKVKMLVQKKGLQHNLHVVGWIDSAEKISLLKKVSVLILPSYHEGLPMSILEGMAAGKAIISTKVGAIPNVVNSENGILIDAGDVSSLIAAMKLCLNSEEMLRSMSEKNRKKIEEYYNSEKMHALLANYYDEVCKM